MVGWLGIDARRGNPFLDTAKHIRSYSSHAVEVLDIFVAENIKVVFEGLPFCESWGVLPVLIVTLRDWNGLPQDKPADLLQLCRHPRHGLFLAKRLASSSDCFASNVLVHRP
jgi:hypothetical protein